MLAASGIWGFELLSENSDWMPWLRWTVLVLSLGGSIGFIAGALLDLKRVAAVALVVGMLGGLGGTAAYSIATASVAHTGSIPSVGASSTSSGGGGFGGGSAGNGGPGGGGTAPTGTAPSGTAPSGTRSGGTSGAATSGGSSSSASLDLLLEESTARWAAAVDGSQSAATLELSAGVAVMAIGGWSDDPAPTLAQFEAWVKAGDIAYYISQGTGTAGGQGGGTSTASAIATWVAAHYTATTVGGTTVYDLSDPK